MPGRTDCPAAEDVARLVPPAGGQPVGEQHREERDEERAEQEEERLEARQLERERADGAERRRQRRRGAAAAARGTRFWSETAPE